MVEVSADTVRENGVTYVRAAVTNTRSTVQTVRVESALDGPTWTPGFGGVTAPEWSEGAWTDAVRPGRCRGLGFATPAEPAEPAVEVTAERRTADEADEPDSRAVLATLEDWSPPSDVLSRER